jgi:hypothetical protein
MRIIKVELPGSLTSADASISLASEEIRAQLFRQIRAIDYELSEHVRQRASTYFPPSYSVFVRTLLPAGQGRGPESDAVQTEGERRAGKLPQNGPNLLTELWIVDPTIRWPQGLLTRSAWRLLVPALAHAVGESYQARLEGILVSMDEKRARLTVLAPTRGWRDPVLLAVFVLILTSLFWLIAQPWLAHHLARLVS